MKQALAGTKINHYHGIDLSEPALELAAKISKTRRSRSNSTRSISSRLW